MIEWLLCYLKSFLKINQCFVKGRSIIKNVLVAQEIIGDIKKRNKFTNVVLMDMTKAYDRVPFIVF